MYLLINSQISLWLIDTRLMRLAHILRYSIIIIIIIGVLQLLLLYYYTVHIYIVSLVLISKKIFGAVTEKIKDGTTGDVAIDFYHRYKVIKL